MIHYPFQILIQLLQFVIAILALNHPKIEINTISSTIIGGLFPVHLRGLNESEPCGQILLEKGIQRLEAMLYAIDQVNNQSGYIPFGVGVIILDTCSSDSFALEQSLQFLQSNCGSHSSKRKVTAIVGAANSAVSEAVANIFRMFKIPQVSYASTSEDLDNAHKYPYFFRVVPSDKFQVQVVLDILVRFQWTFISAVASEGDYGENAVKNLQDLTSNLTETDICFATTILLSRKPTEEEYDNAINSLKKHEKAKVVIVFLNEEKVSELLSASRRNRVPENRFLWIGSDGWGAKVSPVRNNEEFAEGAITLLPKRFPIKGFDDYFLSLRPATNQRNPWFKEFWEKQFDCQFKSSNQSKSLCTGEEDLRSVYRQEGLVPMVIDSVMLIISSIHTLCKKKPLICSRSQATVFQKELKETILKANMTSSQGHGVMINFDQDRNIPTSYTVYQYQRVSKGKNTHEYVEIGEWNRKAGHERLEISGDIVWNNSEIIPRSSCSDECDVGEERILHRHRRCCWTCRSCGDREFLPDIKGHCTPCPEGSISSDDMTDCKELELVYIGKNLRSPWALVPFSFAIFGLVFTVVVLAVFLLYRKTPIIMAAGRELCYIILTGAALCYIFTFVVLAKPTELSCGILRTSMGLGLAVSFSAIFTKTNRISRIFNRSIRIAKRPAFISPESQVVICACLILIQVILSVMWLILSSPTTKTRMVSNPPAYILECGFDGTSVILNLLYNMILICLCTYYAYKTRNIPENFNESKYISFTMYASCIVWLSFIPIYCSTWENYKVQSTILCMSVSISGSVTLACLFIPKIYIVLFRPEKNVRSLSTPTSSTPTISIAPVRFLRSYPNSPIPPHKLRSKKQEFKSMDDVFIASGHSGTNLAVSEK